MPRKRNPPSNAAPAPHTDSADTARERQAAKKPAPHRDSSETSRQIQREIRQIKHRQRILRAAGFNVVVDGIWGKRSQQAWKKYKRGETPGIQAVPFTTRKGGNVETARNFKQHPDTKDNRLTAAQKLKQDRADARAAAKKALNDRKKQLKKLRDQALLTHKNPRLARDVSFHRLSGIIASRPDLFDFSTGKGPAVTAVQNWLQAHGYIDKVTGTWDRKTLDMLRLAEKRAAKARRTARINSAREFYNEWGLEVGKQHEIFKSIGGQVPTPEAFAKFMDEDSFTGSIILKEIAEMIEGGDAKAWDFGTRVQAIQELKADQFPFGLLSFYVNAFGASEAAKRFSDADILMNVLTRSPADRVAKPGSQTQRAVDFQQTTLRNTQITTLLRSQNQAHLQRMVIAHAVVDDQKIRAYNAKLAAEQPWWADGLEALVKPGEWSLTAGVLVTDKVFAELTGGPDVDWEDAMVQAGLEPSWYVGDMQATASPLLQFAGLMIVDPLNFLAPIKYGSMGVRGVRGLTNATSGSIAHSFRWEATKVGRYRTIQPRKNSILQRVQVYNTGRTRFTKEIVWERGSYRAWDAIRGIDSALPDAVTQTPFYQKAKDLGAAATRLKNESLSRAGRRSLVQSRRFFDGSGVKHPDAPTYRGINSNLRSRVDNALDTVDKMQKFAMYRVTKHVEEMGDNGISLFIDDALDAPSSLGASQGAAMVSFFEAQLKVAYAARAAKEYLSKKGYWGIRDQLKKYKQDLPTDIKDVDGLINTARRLEEEAHAEFQRVFTSFEAAYVGGGYVDDVLQKQLRQEVTRFKNVVFDTILPHWQRQIEARAAEKGIKMWDDSGRWAGRYDSKIANRVRELAKESFDKPVEITNNSYGKLFTRAEMRQRITYEVAHKFGRAEFYMNRARKGLYDIDEDGLQEFLEQQASEVARAWQFDPVSNKWRDTRRTVMVSDLYARQYRMVRDGVERSRTQKSWIGDWLASVAENPEKATGSMGDLMIGEIVHAYGRARFSEGALKGVPKGVTSGVGDLIDDNIRIRQSRPQDPQFGMGAAKGNYKALGKEEAAKYEAGYRGWAGAIDELHRQQMLAADRVMVSEIAREGAVYQALNRAKQRKYEIVARSMNGMMRTWQFFTLPMRPGWVVRNSVDNFIKALIAGAWDPRLYYSGAAQPGEGTKRFFQNQAVTLGHDFDYLMRLFSGGKVQSVRTFADMNIDALLGAVRFLDGMFSTNVLTPLKHLMNDTLFGMPDEHLKNFFKAHGIPFDEGTMGYLRAALMDADVEAAPLMGMVNELEDVASMLREFNPFAELPSRVHRAVFGKYADIDVPEQELHDLRFHDLSSRTTVTPDAAEVDAAMRLDAAEGFETLGAVQRKVYNDTYHASLDRQLDEWYAGRGTIYDQVQDIRRVTQRTQELDDLIGSLRSEMSFLETKMTVPAVKELGDYKTIGNRIKRRRRAKGKVNAYAHDLLAKNGGEVTPEIAKLLDEVTEISAEIERLKELRDKIRTHPEVVDIHARLQQTRQQLADAEQERSMLRRKESKSVVEAAQEDVIPWDAIYAEAREEAWDAVKAMPKRAEWYQSVKDFSDDVWQLMGERPEAYFRRIIYRSRYAKNMNEWRTYIARVDKEMAEMRARVEKEEMNYRDALGQIRHQEGVVKEAEQIVQDLIAKYESKIVFEIHPFYVSPASTADFHIGQTSQFVMDEKDIATAAGRSVGADLASFRSLHKDKVAAGYDRVRGYIVTRNGKVIEVRVTKIENLDELPDVSQTRYPTGGSMDVEMRTDRIGGQGPEFSLAPRNKPGERHLDKGHKFETKKRKFKGGKMNATRIAAKIKDRIKTDFAEDPRFNPDLWERPPYTGASPLVEREMLEREALDSAAADLAIAIDGYKQQIRLLEAQKDELVDLVEGLLPWGEAPWAYGDILDYIFRWDFRKAQEFQPKLQRGIEDWRPHSDLSEVEAVEAHQLFTQAMEDIETLRVLESERRVGIMEAENLLEGSSAKLVQMQGQARHAVDVQKKILERRAKYVKKLYDEFTDVKITEAEAKVLVERHDLSDLQAKADAISAIHKRRQKKVDEFLDARGLKTQSEIELAAHNDAWKLVKDTLFDYSAITNIEDNFRFFFPFIQFWRKNTGFWLKSAAKHPGIPAGIAKFEDSMDKWNEDVPESMRRYIRLSGIIPHLPDGLKEIADALSLEDFGFDPLNMTSLAPLWRFFKSENPTVRDEDMGMKFVGPMVESMQDMGLGFAPWAYKPMEWAGIVNQRSWQTVFPQQSLMTAFTRTFFHDLDQALREMDGGWAKVAGYILTGTNPTEVADNFDYWVNIEMIGQAERGEPVSRARAETVMRGVFYTQAVSTYFTGMWLRRMNSSDIHMQNILEEMRGGRTNFTDEEWRIIRMWGKRGFTRDKFDEYVAFLPQIEAYYRQADFDAAEEMLKEHPEILPYVRRKGSKAYSPRRWESTLNMQAKVDNATFWEIANTIDELDVDDEMAFKITNTYVTPELAEYWEKSATPKKIRDRMARSMVNNYYVGLNKQFFNIPETDFDAKAAFIDAHPDIQVGWWRNNDKEDDFRDVWNTANADLRETYFEIVNANGGENWDEAEKFLKQFPFMFEGTKAAKKINPDTGEWKATTAKGRAYRAVKAEMEWFFKTYLPKVGAKQAFNWLFSNPDDSRAAPILDYLKKYGKNRDKLIALLEVWEIMRRYFAMPKEQRGEWLRSGSPEAKALLAYFKKYASKKGMSQHAKDYTAVKHLLDKYFGMSKQARRIWLKSGSAEAAKVLAYFKKYSKPHEQGRGIAQAAEALLAKNPALRDANPELHLRLQFWQRYFSLPPDEREAFIINNAEDYGIFIYGNWGDQERHELENEYYRKAVGAGASRRMAEYMYVAPLLEFYFDIKDSFEKNLFLRVNPELAQYLDKYSDRELSKDPRVNRLLEQYFDMPYGSQRRDDFARKNPEVQKWLSAQGSPADRAIGVRVEHYFSLPKGEARRNYLALHPELQEWFDRATDERHRRNAIFDAFDKADPRMRAAFAETGYHAQWAEATRRKLRRRMMEELLGEDVASSRTRKPLAPRR